MKIQNLGDPSFAKYGRVYKGLDVSELMRKMEETPLPDDVLYVPSDAALESLAVAIEMQNRVFGGLPVQIGYCNGDNHKLNAIEYHRSSEVNVACTDMIFILGLEEDIQPETYQYDTGKMEAFFVPKGTVVEVYATALHYAPISADGKFRSVVVLPRGTNQPLEHQPGKQGEDRLLLAKNKWLIAHPESGLQADGAFVGLTGENLTI